MKINEQYGVIHYIPQAFLPKINDKFQIFETENISKNKNVKILENTLSKTFSELRLKAAICVGIDIKTLGDKISTGTLGTAYTIIEE